MPFATHTDVGGLLGRALNLAEQTAATEAIAEAEGEIVTLTGQRFYAGSDTFRGASATGAVLLPQHPVTAVTAWRIFNDDGTYEAQALTDLTRVYNVVYGLPSGVLVEVDYDYGYATIPAAIKGICVRAALRALTNLSLGGSAENPRTDVLPFPGSDLATLKRFKDPRAGTLFLLP